MKRFQFALITGASSGIGKAIAESIAQRRINVLLVALPGTGLEDVCNSIQEKYGVSAKGLELDLTCPDAAELISDWCCKEANELSILVNNAGFGNLMSFENTDRPVISRMMILNNQSMVLLTHALLPLLKRSKRAHILNVASMASFMPLPNKAVYAATKSFVFSFSASLRLELQESIRVSCLCPGATRTNADVVRRIEMSGAGSMFIQSPEEVAEEAVCKMLRGVRLIIPGIQNRVVYYIRQLVPYVLVCWIVARVFTAKKRKVNEASKSPLFSLALAYR